MLKLHLHHLPNARRVGATPTSLPYPCSVVRIVASHAFVLIPSGKEGNFPEADQGGQEQVQEDPRYWSPDCQAQGEEGSQVDRNIRNRKGVVVQCIFRVSSHATVVCTELPRALCFASPRRERAVAGESSFVAAYFIPLGCRVFESWPFLAAV